MLFLVIYVGGDIVKKKCYNYYYFIMLLINLFVRKWLNVVIICLCCDSNIFWNLYVRILKIVLFVVVIFKSIVDGK